MGCSCESVHETKVISAEMMRYGMLMPWYYLAGIMKAVRRRDAGSSHLPGPP